MTVSEKQSKDPTGRRGGEEERGEVRRKEEAKETGEGRGEAKERGKGREVQTLERGRGGLSASHIVLTV